MPSESLGSRPGSVVTGRDREVRGAPHNWPSVVRVWEGLVGRDLLFSYRTSDASGGPGPAAPGRDREVRGATHNWPSVARLREGLGGRGVLVSSRTSDSCGGPGAVRASQGCQVHGVASDTLVRLASGLDARCVKKQYA